MAHEEAVRLFDQMENESKFEIIRKFGLKEIEAAIRIASEKLAGHDQEWFGMKGTCWEIEDGEAKRKMLRKLLWAFNAKAQILMASTAA